MNTTTIDMNLGAAVMHVAPAVAESTTEPTTGIRERGPELAVSGLLMAIGGLVVFDSARIGAGWADDGPQSGYFPFYIGLMLLASSGWVMLKALRGWMAERTAQATHRSGAGAEGSPLFVEHEQLRLVMAMLMPATLYVVAMGYTGLYAASVVLIAWFMRRHGGFGWTLSSAVSVGVPLTVFFVFERLFLVPLPKGPIERLLGL